MRAELADRVHLARRDDEVVGLMVLQDQPHALDEVGRVAPVALGGKVAEEEAILAAMHDVGDGQADLAGDERLPAALGLVVEEDAVAGEDPVGFAVIARDPIGVDLGDAIGAARVERGSLGLRDFDDLTVEFGRRRLVDANLLLHLQDADGLKQAERADAVRIGGVFRDVEGHLDVRHRTEVVDLVRLHVADDADEVGAVAEVAVVQLDLLDVDVTDEVIHVEVLNALGVEAGRAADEAMDLVALVEQELSEVGAVLAGDAGNQCAFFHG